MFGRKNRDRIAEQDAEIAELAYQLHKEEERANRIAGRLATAEGQLAAARIERATAQQERDGYREDAVRYRANKARLAAANERRHLEALQRAATRSGDGGSGCIQPKPNGAAVQGAVS